MSTAGQPEDASKTTFLIEDERACAGLVASFAYYVDHARYEELADLFTRDGSFSRPGVSAQGRQQILECWSLRPITTTVTRHVCTMPVFTAWSETEVKSVSYATMYSAEPGTGPFPRFKTPAALVEYHDTFGKAAGQWKISKREVVVVMLGAP